MFSVIPAVGYFRITPLLSVGFWVRVPGYALMAF